MKYKFVICLFAWTFLITILYGSFSFAQSYPYILHVKNESKQLIYVYYLEKPMYYDLSQSQNDLNFTTDSHYLANNCDYDLNIIVEGSDCYIDTDTHICVDPVNIVFTNFDIIDVSTGDIVHTSNYVEPTIEFDVTPQNNSFVVSSTLNVSYDTVEWGIAKWSLTELNIIDSQWYIQTESQNIGIFNFNGTNYTDSEQNNLFVKDSSQPYLFGIKYYKDGEVIAQKDISILSTKYYLPVDNTNDYIYDIPNVYGLNVVHLTDAESNFNQYALEWIGHNDIYNYEVQIKYNDSEEFISHGNNIVNDNMFYLPYDENILGFRVRAIDKLDSRRMSQWSVVDKDNFTSYHDTDYIPQNVDFTSFDSMKETIMSFIDSVRNGIAFLSMLLQMFPSPVPEVIGLLCMIGIIVFLFKVIF